MNRKRWYLWLLNKQSFKGFVYSYRVVQQLLIFDESCVQNLESGSLLVYDLWPYKQVNKKLTCMDLSSRYGDADFFIDRFYYFILKIIIVSWKNSILQLREIFLQIAWLQNAFFQVFYFIFINFYCIYRKCMKRAFIKKKKVQDSLRNNGDTVLGSCCSIVQQILIMKALRLKDLN